jgi:hypothetical protein
METECVSCEVRTGLQVLLQVASISQLTVSRLSRQCGILNISQRQNPDSEMSSLKKNRTMDNVRNCDSYIRRELITKRNCAPVAAGVTSLHTRDVVVSGNVRVLELIKCQGNEMRHTGKSWAC